MHDAPPALLERPNHGLGDPAWPAWSGIAALAVAFVVAQLLIAVIAGAAGIEAGEDLSAGLALGAAAVQEGAFVGAALFFARLAATPRPWQFGLRRTSFWRAVGWAALGVICFYVIAAVYVALAGAPDQSTADDIGADESELATIGAGVLFVLIAPVAEEFLFRGFLYGALRNRLGVPLSVVIAGTIFGSLHVFSGPKAVPLLVVLGVILCLVYELTRSLYPCIAIHAVNNALAYGGQTDADPLLAAGLGVGMVAACVLVPRVAGGGVTPPSRAADPS